jgi:hypothetical protein
MMVQSTCRPFPFEDSSLAPLPRRTTTLGKSTEMSDLQLGTSFRIHNVESSSGEVAFVADILVSARKVRGGRLGEVY